MAISADGSTAIIGGPDDNSWTEAVWVFRTGLGRKPGDCDGDGSVSIGEVQKAINMFLGSQVTGCGADCNADGNVSIGEVQKVINGFLGNPIAC